MFNFFKKADNDNILKNLARIFKNGLNINVNVNVSGTLDVKQERGDSLEAGKVKEFNSYSREEKGRSERDQEQESEPNIIPDFSGLSIPEVKFGNEED